MAVDGQIVHGQLACTWSTVTVTPVEGVSILPLSSVARLRIVMLPLACGVNV